MSAHHSPDPDRRGLALGLAAPGLVAVAPSFAQAPQSRFPDRPITLLVPFGPGGVADLTARAVAEQMSKSLGVAIVVDNKPGSTQHLAAKLFETVALGCKVSGNVSGKVSGKASGLSRCARPPP